MFIRTEENSLVSFRKQFECQPKSKRFFLDFLPLINFSKYVHILTYLKAKSLNRLVE